MWIARPAWKFIVRLCVGARVCMYRRMTTSCTWKQTAFLSLSFSSATEKIVSHTQLKKVLKIYLKFTAAHQFIHVYVIFLDKLTRFHRTTFFFGFRYYFSLFRIKKISIPFKPKRSMINFELYSSWVWLYIQQQATDCITQPVLFAYLKFLFTWIILFFVPAHVAAFFDEHFFFCECVCTLNLTAVFSAMINLSFFQGV